MVYKINQFSLSFRALDGLNVSSSRLEKSLERLSTGLRINSGADDPSGLGLAERLRRQARGMYQAIQNSQNGVSLLQTADTALEKTASTLQDMRDRASSALNGALSAPDRMALQSEVMQMRDELNQIAWNTEFNTMRLLDGSRTAVVGSTSGSAKGIVTGVPESSGQYLVSIALINGGSAELQRTQTFTLKDAPGTLAAGTTQLQSIAEFYDGLSIFSLQTPQTLTIQGNSQNTTITIDGGMNLNQLAAAIQTAMSGSSGLEIAGSRAAYVGTAQSGLAGVGGYLEIGSGFIGDKGDFTLVADSAVLTSLGLSNARDARNNLVELTLADPFGGISKVRTSSDRASGLLAGVDVRFTSQAAQIAGSRGLGIGLDVTVAQSFVISAGVLGSSVEITLDVGTYTFDGLARSINSQISAAGTITGLTTTNDNGELKFEFVPPSTAMSTIFNISSATTSATTIGLTNGAFDGSTRGTHAAANEVWGFSRYYASSSTGVSATSTAIFTIYDGNTAGASVDITAFTTLGSASATVADLVTFLDFQTSANNRLISATLGVRVDQVGSTFAFTALRVGTENRDNNTPLSSQLSLAISGSAAALQSGFQFQFGITPGTSYGSGDKNFTLFVAKTNANFQVGPNAGESMPLNINNMGAEALGVDNLDLSSVAGAEKALALLDRAIDTVSAERGKLGSLQNRLAFAVTNLTEQRTNSLDAESKVRDVDVASEIVEFTRNSLFLELGTGVLAQANLLPGKVLQLLNNG